MQWPDLFREGVRFLYKLRMKPRFPGPPLMPTLPEDTPLVGQKLNLSLYLRDRNGSAPLLGVDDRSAIDFAKVSRSTRMIFGRALLGKGRIQPFAQIGAGYFRMDTDTRYVGDLKVGVQYGLGVQIRLNPSCAIAVEANQSLFYRDPRVPQHFAPGGVFSVYAALRLQF